MTNETKHVFSSLTFTSLIQADKVQKSQNLQSFGGCGEMCVKIFIFVENDHLVGADTGCGSGCEFWQVSLSFFFS